MAWDCSLHQHKVTFCEDLHYLKVLNLHLTTTIAAGHTHTFEYFGWIRSRTNRTWGTLTVVLTVRGIIYTRKTMSLNNPLETFTLGSTNSVYEISFFKNLINGDGLT